jgi:ketosteroid isomerase-like protein
MMRPAFEIDLASLKDDPAGVERFQEHFRPFVHPDFEVEIPFAAEGVRHRGTDALVEAWTEFLSVFSSYRPQMDEVVDVGDGRVAMFGHDRIATAEGIEMSIPVGAVYEIEEGMVRRARFFPDQAAARAAIA